MIEILSYISFIAGGLLILLLILSIIGGLDLDIEFDANIDTGDLGYVKSTLTFLSIGSWVVKLLVITQVDPVLAFTIGIAAGAIAVYILMLFLRFLLSQQSEVNWAPQDALFENGTVYLRIPADGQGIIRVNLKGGNRELKARSQGGIEIPTGTKITVEGIEDTIAIVRPIPLE